MNLQRKSAEIKIDWSKGVYFPVVIQRDYAFISPNKLHILSITNPRTFPIMKVDKGTHEEMIVRAVISFVNHGNNG
jgi:hypothetical protein